MPAPRTSQSARVGRDGKSAACGSLHFSPGSRSCRRSFHSSQGSQVRGSRRHRRQLLVFLHVLRIGERQSLHHRQERINEPLMRPVLARTSSAASGFRFCGMIDEPVENLSERRTKPNCGVDQMTISSARPRQMGSANCRSRKENPARSRGPIPNPASCASVRGSRAHRR